MDEKRNAKKSADPLKYCGPYKRLICLGCFLSGLASVINMLPYICIWKVTELLFEYYPEFSNAKEMVRYGYIAFAVAVLGVIVYCSGLMCTHIAAFNTARIMREKAVEHLVKLPMGFFAKNTSGSLRRLIDENSGLTETFIAHRLPDFVGAMVAPIATIIILVYFDWRLGIASLISTIIGFAAMSGMMSVAKVNMVNYQKSLDAMNGEAVEYVRGILVVKTFQQTVFSMRRFMKTIEDYNKWAVAVTRGYKKGKCVFDVITNSAYAFLIPAAIIFFGAAASLTDFENLFVNVIFYILFTPYLSVLMTKIMFTAEDLTYASLAVERIDGILNAEPLCGTKKDTEPADYSISFENVSFAYDEEKGDVLHDISFTIPEGKTVALVGPSGGGKSTIASLIPRFYDVKSGSVRIGGADIRDINGDRLLHDISFVFQQNRLFKESILENIKEAKPDASMEEVMRAVRAAQCEDIIEKLPEGLNTVIGTKSVYLSGGEAQRIALAGAVLKNAPIVLLDEATAFADPENEYRIQKAFSELIKGKTVLMIAHRLSTVRNADCIYVIANGRIAESGKHEELLERNGVYKAMWDDYNRAAGWKLGKEAQQ